MARISAKGFYTCRCRWQEGIAAELIVYGWGKIYTGKKLFCLTHYFFLGNITLTLQRETAVA
jgi:hypothetical protein